MVKQREVDRHSITRECISSAIEIATTVSGWNLSIKYGSRQCNKVEGQIKCSVN